MAFKRRFAVFTILVSVALSFCGCVATTEDEINFPWPVYVSVIYTLQSNTIPEGAASQIDEYFNIITSPFQMEYVLSAPEGCLQVDLMFDNYREFLRFFGIAEEKQVKHGENNELFYMERHYTFENPWATILGDEVAKDKINDINFHVKTSGIGFALDELPKYFFTFSTSFRRTSVTGAYKHENKITEHHYYFYGNPDREGYAAQITVTDRFANTTPWYVTAILATLMFMGAVYLVLKGRERLSLDTNKTA